MFFFMKPRFLSDYPSARCSSVKYPGLLFVFSDAVAAFSNSALVL